MSTKEKTPDTDEATAKGGKKKLIVILLVVLLAVGGGAYFFLFSGSAKAAGPVAGAVLPLDSIAVNLAGGGYLKVGVTLQLVEGVDVKTVDGAKAQDIVISTFSQAQPADVTGAREALKKSLEQKIVAAYDGNVMGIYYSEYVTQ